MEKSICLNCSKFETSVTATRENGEIIHIGSTACFYMGRGNPAFWLLPVNSKLEPDIVECTGFDLSCVKIPTRAER